MKIKPLALLISLALPVTAFAAPKVVIDAPIAGSTQSGIIQIWGWASDEVPMNTVVIYIDDNPTPFIPGYGSERSDVEDVYPDDSDPHYSGYAGAFHTKTVANGEHTLTAVATNDLGETTTTTRKFVVSNTPDLDINRDEIDTSMATARVTDKHIFLDGVAINGRLYDNVELEFDDVLNGFRFSGFKDDLNRDGFPDDDFDQDGFHDDDEDRDSYHDDDLNHDGTHDIGDDHGSGDDDGPGHDVGDDHGLGDDDGPGHDIGDDHGLGDDDGPNHT